jgi:hypothetical protein
LHESFDEVVHSFDDGAARFAAETADMETEHANMRFFATL